MSGNATSVGILPWSIKRVIIILGLKGHLEIEYLLCWGCYVKFRSHTCIILATRTFIKTIKANIAGGIVDNNS